VPELAGVDLEERIAALVQARRGELAELVRGVVDRELERLVEQELRARNGHTPRSPPPNVPTRLCAVLPDVNQT